MEAMPMQERKSLKQGIYFLQNDDLIRICPKCSRAFRTAHASQIQRRGQSSAEGSEPLIIVSLGASDDYKGYWCADMQPLYNAATKHAFSVAPHNLVLLTTVVRMHCHA